MKPLIYQIFTRLYGNNNKKNVFNGTIEENGCAKLNGFTMKQLQRIADYGFTHVWFTGVIEHATQTDYSAFGIACDHPAIVKGRAGSPYAIKDYYDIDPDLAVNVPNRMREFENLVKRVHKANLKFVIDFVPNHVARQYHSDAAPLGVEDLGASDDSSKGFDAHNNFYYCVGESLHTNFSHEVTDKPYEEFPAKATGNDHFDAYPSQNDWYETVKLNYGIDYLGGRSLHFEPIPSTWLKMTDILLFWAGKGVDAFRCDMAEMVPAEFWNYAISKVREKFPHIQFIAEIYNPNAYRSYIHSGFDYLYDKVGLYDTLRAIVCGYASANAITQCWQRVDDIRDHMLNFLENHDEQRIASSFFAGNPLKALPALVVGAMIGNSPFMVYAGQEIGEEGMEQEGFSGCDGRTTIFDYRSVETLRKLTSNNPNKLFTDNEAKLYDYYRKVLLLCRNETALNDGFFFDLQYANRDCANGFDSNRQYVFLRQSKNRHQTLLVVCNFDDSEKNVGVNFPQHAFDYLQIKEGRYEVTDLLSEERHTIDLAPSTPIQIKLPAYGSVVFSFKK